MQHTQQYGGGSGTATMTEPAMNRLTTTASMGSSFTQSPPGFQSQYSTYGDAVAQATNAADQSNGMQILGEQVIEHEVTVPVRRMVEEVVERVITVPERVQREEIVEEKQTVRERIVHVAQPVEKKVYVDDVQVIEVEKIVEVPQVVEQENITYFDKWETQEVLRKVPKVIETERIVEVEQEELVFVDVPRTVEVPETRVIEKIVEKPVPRYVDVEVPEIKEVEVVEEIRRAIPTAVEHVVHQTYNLPTLEAEYEEVPLPVFVPAFTEVAVPAEYMTDEAVLQTEELKQKIARAAAGPMPSLCVIEGLGDEARKMQVDWVKNPQTINQRMSDKIGKYHQQQQQSSSGGRSNGN